MKFELLGNEGPLENAKWTLLTGVGEVDETTGVYTEPASIPVGSLAVISGVFEVPGVITLSGFMAVPLPLSKYVDIIDSVNTSIRLSSTGLNG